MNKEQRQIKKRIDKAYSKLHVLSNMTWTPYRDEIFYMNKKDEKRHRFNRPSSDFEASINDCAKMFTVKNIAESLLTPNKYQIKDLIRLRKSGTQKVMETNLSLDEAKRYCSRPDTKGKNWFCGFTQQ